MGRSSTQWMNFFPNLVDCGGARIGLILSIVVFLSGLLSLALTYLTLGWDICGETQLPLCFVARSQLCKKRMRPTVAQLFRYRQPS